MVDDGSTDGTAEVARPVCRANHRRQLERTWCFGRAQSRHRARAGRAAWFLDADDLLPPHYLARFVDAAAAAPVADVFHCGWRGVDFDDGHVLYAQDLPFDLDGDPFHALAAAGSPPISALAVRRAAAPRSWSVRRGREPAGGLGLLAPAGGFRSHLSRCSRERGDHPTPQREHVGLGGNTAGRRRPRRPRAASLASPTVSGLHPRGRRSAKLAAGGAPLVGPRRRAPAPPQGPPGPAGRRGRRGRLSAASRLHGMARVARAKQPLSDAGDA